MCYSPDKHHKQVLHQKRQTHAHASVSRVRAVLLMAGNEAWVPSRVARPGQAVHSLFVRMRHAPILLGQQAGRRACRVAW